MNSDKTNKCGKCGFCLAVCPVYNALTEEQASPRAKIQLIRAFEEGRVTSSVLLKDLVAKCLMCGSCTANCPSEVDHYSQFTRMRSEMIKDHGERIGVRGLIYLLAREKRLGVAASLARVGQSITPSVLKKKYALANIPLTKFPDLNKRGYRASVAEEIAPTGREVGKVLYFTGCATNHIFAETGVATLQVLGHMGFRVIIPRSQTCCSLPLLFHGAEEKALENIHANIGALSGNDVEAIIVDCPTCGSTLKNEYPKILAGKGDVLRNAREIADKISDIMGFINAKSDLLRLDQDKTAKAPSVTYHSPCHLKNFFEPADKMLKNLEGIDFIPAENGDTCCGGGGTFFYEYPEIATTLATQKIKIAQKTGATLWLTDCPVCRINLAGRQTEEGVKLMHPVKFLASLLKETTV